MFKKKFRVFRMELTGDKRFYIFIDKINYIKQKDFKVEIFMNIGSTKLDFEFACSLEAVQFCEKIKELYEA